MVLIHFTSKCFLQPLVPLGVSWVSPRCLLGASWCFLVSQLDQLPDPGPTVTGKVLSGRVQQGDKIFAKNLEGEVCMESALVNLLKRCTPPMLLSQPHQLRDLAEGRAPELQLHWWRW